MNSAKLCTCVIYLIIALRVDSAVKALFLHPPSPKVTLVVCLTFVPRKSFFYINLQRYSQVSERFYKSTQNVNQTRSNP